MLGNGGEDVRNLTRSSFNVDLRNAFIIATDVHGLLDSLSNTKLAQCCISRCTEPSVTETAAVEALQTPWKSNPEVCILKPRSLPVSKIDGTVF